MTDIMSRKILCPFMANMNVQTVEKMANIVIPGCNVSSGSQSTPTLDGRKTDHCVSSGTSIVKILFIHRRRTMVMVTTLEVEEVEVWVNILSVRKETGMQVVGQDDNTEDDT